MSTYQYISVTDLDGGIRVLHQQREDSMNAWNLEMRMEMITALGEVPFSGARVLIITGSPKAFGVGEDVRGMEDLSATNTQIFRAWARQFHSALDQVEAMEIPVIAAIEGVAAGGGMELALSCDFRIIGRAGRMAMPEINVGLIPGSGGCSRLVQLVGLAKAKEIVMLEGILSAEQAYEYGLVTRLVDEGTVYDEALSMARHLAQRAPLALGMSKLVLNTCANVDLETGRRLERIGQSVLKKTSDHAEGASAFLEKRKPQWTAS